MTEPNETETESSHTTEVATFIASGGALTSGLAVAGTTAIGVGLLPVVALGMVVGLAAYGVKRALFDDMKSASQSSTQVSEPVPPGQGDGAAEIMSSADV